MRPRDGQTRIMERSTDFTARRDAGGSPSSDRDRDHDSLTLGPNWFASVMGTGIVATAGATLPFHVKGMHVFTLSIWLVSLVVLTVLIVAFAVHGVRHPGAIGRYARDVTLAQFFGAPPMALLTVGAGALLVGRSLIGDGAALALDWVLWSAGTVTGLATAVAVPYLLFTRLEVRHDAAFGGWLMPVVPPMVSAASGGLLIAHVSSQTGRATLLYGCYAMFGMSHHPHLVATGPLRLLGFGPRANPLDRPGASRPVDHRRGHPRF